MKHFIIIIIFKNARVLTTGKAPNGRPSGRKPFFVIDKNHFPRKAARLFGEVVTFGSGAGSRPCLELLVTLASREPIKDFQGHVEEALKPTGEVSVGQMGTVWTSLKISMAMN